MSDSAFDRSFWNGVLKRVIRRTRGAADAEDLLHSAFLRLHAYRAVKPVDNPAAFLVRTAVNLRVDNYRRDRLNDARDLEQMPAGENNAPLQDEVLASRVRLERVRQGLERLPPRTREIFLMNRLENMKYREIAERLGISQSAVEKHIARAMHFLTDWAEGW